MSCELDVEEWHRPIERVSAKYPMTASLGAFANPAEMEGLPILMYHLLADIFRPEMPLVPSHGKVDVRLGQLDGASVEAVVSEIWDKVVKHSIQTRHPWSLAHMVPPPATISIIADLIIGAMNQCAFVWEQAPSASEIEEEVIKWLTERLEYGATAGGILTSGGTLSNCLAAYLALERARSRGVAHRLCIIASDQAHFSVDKAARLIGLGAEAVVRCPTNAQGRLVPGTIRTALGRERARGRTPFLVICTAGTTNTGALEDIQEPLAVAKDHNCWLHLDAAHGGFVCLANPALFRARQFSTADSISWDPHKSLYTSYSVGALLVRDRTTLSPLAFHSEYALKRDGMADAGTMHLEGSRRFEALKLWMTIRYFGISGFTKSLNRTVSLARYLANAIQRSDDFHLVTDPDTNIVCFRFAPSGAPPSTLDALNQNIQRVLFASGGPLFSSTRVGGVQVLRAVILNPNTTVAHLDAALSQLRMEAHRQLALSINVLRGAA